MPKEIERDLVLYDTIKTKLQTIRLFNKSVDRLMFTINNFVQFVEGEDEQIYHEALTKPAFELNPEAKEFLILGGGDGLVARNIRKLVKIPWISLVDFDEELVEFCKTNERIKALNENSLEYCHIYNEDAIEWVKNRDFKYDIVICDFPDPTNDVLNKLYTKEFYSSVIKRLKPNGVLSVQCNVRVLEEVAQHIKEVLGNSKIINYEMPYLGEGGVIIGNVIT